MVTKEEVLNAQQNWGEAVIKIGKLYLEKKDYKAEAIATVAELYGYDEDQTVLFKPTKASEKAFRFTAESAVSYLAGGNEEFPEDLGFALNPWTKVHFENKGLILRDDDALSMGYYYFEDMNGEETKVEFTFGYYRSEKGNLKIYLQHSSFPFKP